MKWTPPTPPIPGIPIFASASLSCSFWVRSPIFREKACPKYSFSETAQNPNSL